MRVMLIDRDVLGMRAYTEDKAGEGLEVVDTQRAWIRYRKGNMSQRNRSHRAPIQKIANAPWSS